MRVTNNMLSSQLLLNLNRNSERMNNTQNQMSTGRKLNKPSDDPVGITYSLRYRSELSSNEQYQRNVDSAVSWLDFNDTVMDQAGQIMQRVRELTVQASTGTNPQSALDSINKEIGQLKEQMIDVVNSQLNGKYIFNGQTYDKKPYDLPLNADNTHDTSGAASIATDTGNVNFIVGENVALPINVTGNEVVGTSADADNLFTIFNQLSSSLASGDIKTSGDQLANIDSRMDKMLKVQSEMGAKSNRVELMQNRLSDLEVNLTDLQSKTEDADYAELLMNSKIQENIYNASLSAGAKIISASLVDFLR
ncbi:flagellar hook-associated protein FlgL [Paenibacillus polymyxa]|uniref:Flagellar hook protein FlgL n=1 Tax=Paenibacillus polymyxa (strain SC2) TaxID=886882 RepID=E3EBN3_PAEPS|nr:flagellar hook-associated protein FlgL [Paenibacillus polymyxa]ADO58851.1 flagellar hook protein FlgL [Paenibacillus polymyxa SC2]WPQ56456.1 flagellar hook-associated protein FlgL [Paenibacillus polymyxa]CCI71382.1 Flagellar filament 33 kDa core protein Class B [Paenibacillus polymyxa M1]